MKINAISIDNTRYFTIRPEDAPFIRSIHTVYCYTPDEATNLCEVTPGFDLRYLYTYIRHTDDGFRYRDQLDDRYCYESNDDIYMHCSVVAKLAPREMGDFESMEYAVEYFQGNCPF